MRKILFGLTVLVATAWVGLTASLAADEEKVPLDNLPKAVVEALKKRFPDAKLMGAQKETENGKTLYELAIENKGRKIEVTLAPDGKIVEIEQQIGAKDMPEAVADALEKKYPKATYKKIEEIIKVEEGKETLEHYEILLVTGEKKFEVSVTPTGKITKAEDKSKENK